MIDKLADSMPVNIWTDNVILLKCLSKGHTFNLSVVSSIAFAVQGLPLGSGMGSSAASAAAGAWAVNALFGAPLCKQALVPAGLASEATVSGYHADNIAPALLGGFVLIR